MLLVVGNQVLGVEIAAVVFVGLDGDLVEHSLDVLHVGVILEVGIDLVASNDHVEFVDFQTERGSNLRPDKPKRLEERNLDLLELLVVHVHAVVHSNRLRLEVVESCSDRSFRQNRPNAFVSVQEE